MPQDDSLFACAIVYGLVLCGRIDNQDVDALIAERSLQAPCVSGGHGGPVFQSAGRLDEEVDIATSCSIIQEGGGQTLPFA